MNRLLINTANSELYIVLSKDDSLFSVSSKAKMLHNEILLPEIDKLLKENNLDITDIDELGVVIGPGSFTGIRVGISTIKGFRDGLNIKAKGINNLEFLFKLARKQNKEIDTVAILGSRDTYFVARNIDDMLYIYDRPLSLQELKNITNKKIGMFEIDENVNCFVVDLDPIVFNECLEESKDEILMPKYFQLSQAENEKLKKIDITIVEANLENLVNIAEIEKESIISNKIGEKEIEKIINNENYKTFVAVGNNEILGYIITEITDEINITSIAVKKEFRNLGIASKLIERIKEFAAKLGFDTISLEVDRTNLKARVLYEKLGFTTRRIRKKYYANGNDCIEMTFKIN